MTPQSLASIASAALSLIFSYVPGLKARYDLLSPSGKRLAMLLMVALVSGGAFGIACLGWSQEFKLTTTCDQQGAIGLVQTFALALTANQVTYLVTPRRSQVETAREDDESTEAQPESNKDSMKKRACQRKKIPLHPKDKEGPGV
jgi:hypothetical protein